MPDTATTGSHRLYGLIAHFSYQQQFGAETREDQHTPGGIHVMCASLFGSTVLVGNISKPAIGTGNQDQKIFSGSSFL